MVVDEILKIVSGTTEFKQVFEIISNILDENSDTTPFINQFTMRIINNLLEDSTFDLTYQDGLIETLIKHIKGDPLKYEVEIKLHDFALFPLKELSFSVNDIKYSLRQTQIKDLEREIPYYSFERKTHHDIPSAILNMEFQGDTSLDTETMKFNQLVEQAITILRLFKVSSLRYISYITRSDSFFHFSCISRPFDKPRIYQIGQVKDVESKKLEAFWNIMSENLPSSLHGSKQTKMEHVTIAYQRYSDALLKNIELEGRIANSVMGLESLFLKGEPVELSFRLKMRICKVFSELNYNTLELKELITDAYRVRSRYVHGGLLSDKKKRNLIKKYEDIKTGLLLPILDILRKAILLMLFVESKKELICLIDEAFIDKERENQLINLINKTIPWKKLSLHYNK